MAIDALIERVEKLGQVEVDLKRLDRMLQAAHMSSIDIKDSYDFYVLALFLFSFLINRYSDVSLMGVPLWSSFFAGLGSSTQILTGVAGDLCRYDVASRYKRFWYMALPLLSMVFGYMAYLIFSSSFMALNLNDNSQSREFSIMLICFLTGFLTKWLIGRSLLSRV